MIPDYKMINSENEANLKLTIRNICNTICLASSDDSLKYEVIQNLLLDEGYIDEAFGL